MKTILTIICLLGASISFAQSGKVGIGTINPKAQLHTTGSVRFDTLKSTGLRPVYVNDSGVLVTRIADSFANNTVIAIPDNTCPGISSPITIASMPYALPSANIRVRINITHTNDVDLRIFLLSPTGQVLNLVASSGGAGDNFTNTIFTDAATQNINVLGTSSAPFSGTYKPAGSLAGNCGITGNVSTFGAIGGGSVMPNGTWTLVVIDGATTNTGTLNSWSISFSNNVNDLTPAFLSAGLVPRGSSSGALVQGSIFDNGNVGIGTIAPTRQLSVYGRLNIDQADTSAGNSADLTIGSGFSGEGIGSARTANAVNTHGLDFYTANEKRMVITNTGSVGIGTNSPAYKLDVAGTVNATSFLGDGSGMTGVVNVDFTQTINGAKTFADNLVANGNLGVGTSPSYPLQTLSASPLNTLIESTSTVGTFVGINNSSAAGPVWELVASGSNSIYGAGKLLLGPGTTFGAFLPSATFLPDGKVGIGTYSPPSALAIDGGNGDALTILNGGDTRVYDDAGTSSAAFYTSAGSVQGSNKGVFTILSDGKVYSFTGTGGTVSSDERLKQDILPIDGSLAKIMQLNGYSYRYKTKAAAAEKEVGVLAQEVKRVLPEAVHIDDNGMYSVSYTALVPLLINGMKEQQAEIVATKKSNAALREQNAELERRLEAIERKVFK